MAQNECKILIKGTQKLTEDDTPEVVQFDSIGTYYMRAGDQAKFITYREYDEDRPDRYRTVLLKYEESGVVTMQKNHSETKLILERGKRHNCIYSTDFGPITMGIYTDKVESTLTEKGGTLFLSYTLDLNSNLASFNTVDLKVELL